MMLVQISYAIAGLALLLFAMRQLIKSLNREVVRYVGSGNAILSGLAATLVVQASSVTIVSTMGFLSRGLITLERSILIVLGAAVGSSLKGLYVFQVSFIAGPILLLVGVLGHRRHLFEVLISIGMIFLGFQLIETGLVPIAQIDFIQGLFEGSIFKTVLFGFFLASVLQSSSAVLLLVISFASQGLVLIPAAMGVLLGANLGTTITPLIMSFGQESVEARKLAYGYFLMKLSAISLVLIYFRTHLAILEDLSLFCGFDKRPAISVVLFHIWFNLMTALSWWVLLPLLLRFLNWLVPGKELTVGTTPFTIGIQKLLGSLPGKALSEGMHKLQQVIRDLHWVSDSIFYLVDRRGSPEKDSELLEKSLQKCERTVEVLGVVRDVAWQSGESREKVLNVILLTADLKNIECLLYSCIKTLSHAYLGKTSQLPNTVDRFRLIREKLNQSWEKIYALVITQIFLRLTWMIAI